MLGIVSELYTMMPALMLKTFVVVLLGTALMTATVLNGHFVGAKVELGVEHYAERMHPIVAEIFPSWLTMPLNTIINIGYVIVGAAWCAYTSLALLGNQIGKNDAKMFYIFNLASCCYGPIQMLRILTHMHGFGVLDQWYTLPFFMWVFLWGVHLVRGWSAFWNILWVLVSVLSYSFVLINPIGFEICLGIHVMLAVLGALLAWNSNPQAYCLKYFILATLSCCGFVILKLLDLELPEYASIFSHISGHFLSKICDILQIHFVNCFFLEVTLASCAKKRKKD
ncbi:transmembrane protein 187-like [Mya arenaria]|uniref:transmembrane protein 187-like n=1 Tax=Mya arenaria TaxID=6604 RepID=UPI0022E6D23F|nr:transmembrane protein 187-like [Mya arenaria]